MGIDRPASPGNLGSIIRSADAFGAHGVIVAGHAADVYDPRTVRASTGSLFALPVVRCPSHREVASWVAAQRARGVPIVLAGTVRLLEAAEGTVEERTLWAQRAEAQREELATKLSFVRASRWIRLGRMMGLGPEIDSPEKPTR